jgi:predicted DCC family thiol-disulfide oxidoreductase YuxK
MSEEVVTYAEVGDRTYELVRVPGPLEEDGAEVWCRIIHARQRIEISDTIPDDEVLSIVAEAVGRAWQEVPGPWRMVPLYKLSKMD